MKNISIISYILRLYYSTGLGKIRRFDKINKNRKTILFLALYNIIL